MRFERANTQANVASAGRRVLHHAKGRENKSSHGKTVFSEFLRYLLEYWPCSAGVWTKSDTVVLRATGARCQHILRLVQVQAGVESYHTNHACDKIRTSVLLLYLEIFTSTRTSTRNSSQHDTSTRTWVKVKVENSTLQPRLSPLTKERDTRTLALPICSLCSSVHIILFLVTRQDRATSFARRVLLNFGRTRPGFGFTGGVFLLPRMGNTDRRGPEISDGWQGTSDDGSGVDTSTPGETLRVAVIGAGVAGLGEDGVRGCVSRQKFLGRNYL